MKNALSLPFERNRYYPGKMLTSLDFTAEQAYINDKRRFVNSMMIGQGIICGCGVTQVDDQSIMVASGVAVDAQGRELVIDTSVVKKLSAIVGFEQLRTNDVALCLRYKEADVHAVYAVGKTEAGEDFEYNRVKESYEMFLLDQEDVYQQEEFSTRFLESQVLYEDVNFKVKLQIPRVLCTGQFGKCRICIQKKSSGDHKIYFHGSLQIPAFESMEGTHEITMDISEENLYAGGETVHEYWFLVDKQEKRETDVVMKEGETKILVDAVNMEPPLAGSIKLEISRDDPHEIIARSIGSMNLDYLLSRQTNEYISIAELKLVRTESAYVIDTVIENSVKKYVDSIAFEGLRRLYSSFYETDLGNLYGRKGKEKPQEDMVTAGSANRMSSPGIASGTLEIPIGECAKKGEIYYSGEILHGLGKGNVYVQVGFELYEENEKQEQKTKITIYGDQNLFDNGNGVKGVKTAVKVLEDKGSFIVAAKTEQEIDYMVLNFQWVAIKFPQKAEMELQENSVKHAIRAETPTVKLSTKSSYYFNVKFENMEPCSITYELTETGNGEISADGVYTAPNKEGVFEIRIYCTDNPSICTYAYAIVKRGNKENG